MAALYVRDYATDPAIIQKHKEHPELVDCLGNPIQTEQLPCLFFKIKCAMNGVLFTLRTHGGKNDNSVLTMKGPLSTLQPM